MNLHFQQWIRSVQLNTNLLPLTCNNITQNECFYAIFNTISFRSELPSLLKKKFKILIAIMFLVTVNKVEFCQFFTFFSPFGKNVFSTIYRHSLNRSKATQKYKQFHSSVCMFHRMFVLLFYCATINVRIGYFRPGSLVLFFLCTNKRTMNTTRQDKTRCVLLCMFVRQCFSSSNLIYELKCIDLIYTISV